MIRIVLVGAEIGNQTDRSLTRRASFSKLEVVLAGSARGGRAPRILQLCTGLRASHREAKPR